jgi:hypothetical protein
MHEVGRIAEAPFGRQVVFGQAFYFIALELILGGRRFWPQLTPPVEGSPFLCKYRPAECSFSGGERSVGALIDVEYDSDQSLSRLGYFTLSLSVARDLSFVELTNISFEPTLYMECAQFSERHFTEWFGVLRVDVPPQFQILNSPADYSYPGHIESIDINTLPLQPVACEGCADYCGKTYGGNRLICAIHPYGPGDLDICPDFQPKPTENANKSFITRDVRFYADQQPPSSGGGQSSGG